MILPACTKDVRRGCSRRSLSLLCTPYRLTVMYQYCFIFSPLTPSLSLSAVDLICRHIAAIVNRHWVSSACCFLPINKAIDPHCCHQFRQKDMQGWITAHQWLHICSSMYLTHTLPLVACDWYNFCESHLYNKTSCLTVAVVIVLHYLRTTNAWTTFSPFIFKYCWDICEDFMSFYWVLLMLISFFMSCDNVMMMCISFLFIELSSNQVCFLHRPFFLTLRNMSRMSYLH